MKKVLGILTAVLVLGLGTSYAMPIYLDLAPANLSGFTGDADAQTGTFNQLNVYVETTSAPTGVGTGFLDIGDLNITGLTSTSSIDIEGLNTVWEMTGRWEDLAGYVSEQVATSTGYIDKYVYQTGTLNLYADGLRDDGTGTLILDRNYDINGGSNDGSSDDDAATFTNSMLPLDAPVATLTLLRGEGKLEFENVYAADGVTIIGVNPTEGDVLLTWKFTYMLPGFWLSPVYGDLEPLTEELDNFVIALADVNTSSVSLRPIAGVADAYFIDSNHDGSVSLDIVPEPATMLLFGSGLLGLAGVGLRKRRKA